MLYFALTIICIPSSLFGGLYIPLRTILKISQTKTLSRKIFTALEISLLLPCSFTSSVTRGTLATTQLGEEAEEEVEAGKEEDGDEEDHSSKLRIILEVQEGITSRLA